MSPVEPTPGSTPPAAAGPGLRCPTCSSARIRSFWARSQGGHDDGVQLSIRECLDCGLAWQFPRLRSVEQSAAILAFRYEEQAEGSYCDPQVRRATGEAELAFLETFVRPPGRLLDIGAGDGAFIALAAGHGWECVGVDPAARLDPGLRSTGTGSFRLIEGTLDDLDPGERFDAVTMWDVIEHLDEPAAVLNAAVPFLKDGGVLVVETGNYQSVDRITSGPDWWAYMSEHRWYFAPPTVRDLLHRAGLAHVAVGPRVLRPWWKGQPTYNGPSRLRTLKKMVRQPSTALRTARQHRELGAAAARWDRWAGLGIFAMVASRQPIRSLAEDGGLIELS